MKVLNQDIKDHTFKKVYCLYGEEDFLKRSYKNRIKTAVIGDDEINLQTFVGKDTDISEVIDLADTMPFFAERRLIIIEDSGLFRRDAEPLTSYLNDMPDSTVIVFIEDAVDRRSRLYKKVAEIGYITELSRQSEDKLANWVHGLVGQAGKRMSAGTVRFFLGCTGDGMDHIKTELDKLISYTEGRDEITSRDVQDICSVRIEGRVFDMISDMEAGRVRAAFSKYNDLTALREPPMRILFLIARGYNELLGVKELVNKGKGKNEIASRMGIRSFAIGRDMAQAGKFTENKLKSCVERCIAAEEDVKTGRMSDEMAVSLVISELSGGGG